MKNSFPAVMKAGSFETLGHSVLITIPGTDESLLPCLYMSHQDVVPVVAGTEQDWTYDAFSGAIEDGYIWGRGTLDIKEMVFGILEAAEYLLRSGRAFRRTAYLAFGDDEETLNLGALGIAQELQRRGVRLEFVLDEGGGKLEDGAFFGAPGRCICSARIFCIQRCSRSVTTAPASTIPAAAGTKAIEAGIARRTPSGSVTVTRCGGSLE